MRKEYYQMKRTLSVFALLFVLLCGKAFAGDFGIGVSGGIAANTKLSGAFGGLSMGFGSEERPIIWDISFGAPLPLVPGHISLLAKTNIDWHIINFNMLDVLSIYLGPGVGLQTTVSGENPFATGVVSPNYTLDIMATITARAVGGIKLFAKDLELFAQLAPQIGWSTGFLVDIQDERLTGLNGQMYWSVEATFGIRLWT